MKFTHLTEEHLPQALACTVTEPIRWVDPDRYRADFDAGNYRLEHTWIAADDDGIHARAVWWTMPDGEHPLALDCLWVGDDVEDRTGLAAGLLNAAHAEFRARGCRQIPEYQFSLDPDWRERADVVAAVE
ncbi:hypothetical protein [Salininema proteolyticum]|uniref:GNAT family N-acetyltransferase n=1 Tax=Salininema proteolyticum TaxID=1607685 RepID=A0ABV8U2T3_9ACTN